MTENVKHVDDLLEKWRVRYNELIQMDRTYEAEQVLRCVNDFKGLQREAAGDGDGVYVDFTRIGRAGPFPVIDGVLTVPNWTMCDLYAAMGPHPSTALRPTGTECPLGVECAKTNPEIHRCYREAEHANTDAGIGAAFLSVLSDPSVKWRDTGAQPFIDRVAKEAGTTAPASAEPGEADTASVLRQLVSVVDTVANSGDYAIGDEAIEQLQMALEDAANGCGDGYPDARGGGEAVWTYPDRNALIREVCDGLRGYRFDVDPVCVMAVINSIPAQTFSSMGPLSRPTPAELWLLVDDALETMELSGMHAEHSYQALRNSDFYMDGMNRADAAYAARATTGANGNG
jgi:hypothetical protein